MKNLTGKWSCPDGLTYNMTQIGNQLFIAGNNDRESELKNVGYGTINQETATIVLTWADTPNSEGFGHHGVLYMTAVSENELKRDAGNPKFGIGNFTRMKLENSKG